MARGDYIPSRDYNFRMWAECFSTNLVEGRERYFVTMEEAAEVRDVVQRYVEALTIATCEVTRTRPNVRAKDEARRACEAKCRPIAMRIKKDERISDADRINAGVPCVMARRARRRRAVNLTALRSRAKSLPVKFQIAASTL